MDGYCGYYYDCGFDLPEGCWQDVGDDGGWKTSGPDRAGDDAGTAAELASRAYYYDGHEPDHGLPAGREGTVLFLLLFRSRSPPTFPGTPVTRTPDLFRNPGRVGDIETPRSARPRSRR